QGQEASWRMLEPLREYALEKLEESGERDLILRRHALYYLHMTEQAVHSLASGGTEQVSWYRRLDAEVDNLRAALDWCLDQAESGRNEASEPLAPAQMGLRLVAALRLF